MGENRSSAAAIPDRVRDGRQAPGQSPAREAAAMTPAESASALEIELDYAAMRLSTAATTVERRAWWNTLCQLHEQRSEERVQQMEREKGLRR
jgi:hypothetical protein